MKDQGKKNKHLTFQDRIEIQECLCKEMTFKDIGKRISKSATTVSREVKGRCIAHRSGYTKTEDICKRLLKASFLVATPASLQRFLELFRYRLRKWYSHR